MPFKVGDTVMARKARNALGNYVQGTVSGVRVQSSSADSTNNHNWLFGEGTIVLHMVVRVLSFGMLCKDKHFYDVKYLDGAEDFQLPEKFVLPVRY